MIIEIARSRNIWPGLTDQELSLILWTCTTFPMGNPEDVLADLKSAYEKSGGDLLQALNQADEIRSKNLISSHGS